jgi:hypothetical protein
VQEGPAPATLCRSARDTLAGYGATCSCSPATPLLTARCSRELVAAHRSRRDDHG